MKADFESSPFAKSLLRSMMRQREAMSQGPGGPMLTTWTDGLHPILRTGAEQVARDDGVRLHSHVRALNSSMVFALNLFLPFRLGDSDPLSALLSSKIGRAVSIDRLVFEYGGPPDILGEVAGAMPGPDDKFTASDVAIFVRDGSGRKGIVLIEVKLTEEGFTNCGGADKRGNRRKDVCASAERLFEDPAACYLRRPLGAPRDRRYWPIFEKAHSSLGEAFPGHEHAGECPFRGHAQQPMRNHALLLGMQQAGLIDFGSFWLVHHDHNPDVVVHWDAYAGIVADPKVLFRATASEVARMVAPPVGPWLMERYLLKEVPHDPLRSQSIRRIP